MKAVLLCSTGGEPGKCGFPFYPPYKQKNLYHLGGEVQLKRIINQLIEAGFKEKDIEIVIGFQRKKIISFLKENDINIKVKINKNYKKSVAYTLLEAIKGINETFVLISADENRKPYFYRQLLEEKNRRYFDGSIYKFLKEDIDLYISTVQKYLNKEYVENKIELKKGSFSISKGSFDTNSGVGMTYIIFKIVHQIKNGYEDVHYIENEENWYSEDLDDYSQTDEFLNRNKFKHKILNFIYYRLHKLKIRDLSYLSSFKKIILIKNDISKPHHRAF